MALSGGGGGGGGCGGRGRGGSKGDGRGGRGDRVRYGHKRRQGASRRAAANGEVISFDVDDGDDDVDTNGPKFPGLDRVLPAGRQMRNLTNVMEEAAAVMARRKTVIGEEEAACRQFVMEDAAAVEARLEKQAGSKTASHVVPT